MKNYDNGFRYISVFGENEEDKEKLNNFLKENDYDTEESCDALNVLARECVGTNEELNVRMKTFMTRVNPEEALLFENSIYEGFCDKVADEVDYATKFTSDDIRDFEFDLDEKLKQPNSTKGVA